MAYYEGEGDLKEPRAFIEFFLTSTKLTFPNTFVLDLGYNKADGWFIIEFNSSWGAVQETPKRKEKRMCVKC